MVNLSLNKNKVRAIQVLLMISGLCNCIAKKLAGDSSGFVFTMPIPGWSFVVNRFCRNSFLSDYSVGKKPVLKNVLDVQSWSMPGIWHDDLNRLAGKAKDDRTRIS